MTTYAAGTSVPIAKSKMELEQLLVKHKAHQRAFADDDRSNTALVLFTLAERQYRLEVPLPKREAFKLAPLKRGEYERKERTAQQQFNAWEQACRERWRAVVLVVKAKLELVALGVSTVEREFLADLVLPNGSRVHAEVAQRIEAAYKGGNMVPMLGPHVPDGDR